MKFKMATVKVLFLRGTDPQKVCLLLISPCTKFHAFIIKCTIFSHIHPTNHIIDKVKKTSSKYLIYK